MKLPKIRLPSPDTIQELALVAGFLMLFYGLHSIYPPLAWVVCGGLLMLFGAWEVVLALLFRKGGG